MPFGYGTRTQQYIDASDAGPRDRIKVTFENDQIIMLLLPETQLEYRGRGRIRLYVDKKLTDAQVLEPFYQHAVNEASRNARRKERRQYTFQVAQTQVEIGVSVRKDGENFDDSPRPGEPLSAWCLFPRSSGSGFRTSSLVKSVEFITI